MTEEVRLHFQRADECIEDAQLLLDGERFAAAVGRAYYVMFHAATAALLQKAITRSSHHGIISAFGESLVKTGLVEQKFHQYFREAFDLRQESDYQPVIDISYKQAEETVKRAREFIRACQKLCD